MDPDGPKRMEVVEEEPTTPAPHAIGPTHPVSVVGRSGSLDRSGEGSPRRRPRWVLTFAVVTATAVAVAAVWYWLSPAAPVERYKTVRVDRGPVSAVVTATGTVNPVITVQVGSQVSGIITKLFVDFNSSVKAGQVVALIDPDPFKAKVAQARAGLETARGNLLKAKTDLAQRELDLKRMRELRPQDFVAQADLDNALTNYQNAVAQVELSRASVDQAAATLASAELDLKHCTIYSPVDGIVVSRNVDVGQTVAASLQTPTLFLIAQDLTHMQVDTNVSEADIGGVTEGKEATFTVDAYPNQPFQGKVVQVRNAPISIQNVVTYDVVIGADNRELKLKPGMTANVTIVRARKDSALRVPSAALRFRPAGTPVERKKAVVWKPDAAGPPRAVQITPGIADQTFTEVADVREGRLQEGDDVIVGIETESSQSQKELPPGFGAAPKGLR